MNSESILSGLNGLKLFGMARAWEASIEQCLKVQEVSLFDGLSLLIQSEKEYRECKKTANLLKKAKFRYNANLGEIIYDSAKGKDRDRIMQLATCDYIRSGISVLITGPTGVGKSYMATALGNHACLQGFKVRYYSMAKLLEDIQLTRIESKSLKFFEQMSDYDVLIIDDFGMVKLTNQQLLDFMELVEDRHSSRSMIITSQLPVDKWYDVLSANATIADSIVDRIKSSHIFKLKGDSMRGKEIDLKKK